MNVYSIDGRVDSFFTAVFDAYKDEHAYITAENDVQLSFLDTIKDIEADQDKSERVRTLIDGYDRELVSDIGTLFRSCDTEKYNTAFRYIRELVKNKASIRGHLSSPAVIDFNETLSKITYEIHRFQGFIRFSETTGGVFYAHYTPDNDITELLMPHFKRRYASQPFVIHDTQRNIIGAYNGQASRIIKSDSQLTVYLSENDGKFTELWKLYYDSVNIQERKNTRLMKAFMPVRYWKNLPEKN